MRILNVQNTGDTPITDNRRKHMDGMYVQKCVISPSLKHWRKLFISFVHFPQTAD